MPRVPRPARFAAIGGACALLQLGLLVLLTETTGLGAFSNAVAFLISGQANFALNRFLTWSESAPSGWRRLSVQALSFNALLLGAVALNQALYLAALLVAPYLVAGAAAILATTLVKYLISDRWIFRAPAKVIAPAPRTATG